ncbi:TPA: hypothetical protein HNV51_26040 [Escherichia coli]|nr:hypothetical protein [Escherichia coli]
MTDFRGKTSIFSHPVYLFLRKFSLQDSRGGSIDYVLDTLFLKHPQFHLIFSQVHQAALANPPLRD